MFDTLAASARAAVLALAVGFLVVPIPAQAADWSDTSMESSYRSESTMPTMNLGDVQSFRAAYFNGKLTLNVDRVDDSTSICMFGFCFKCAIHGAHHSFNGVKRKHIQLTTWRKGVKGSGRNYRFPLPFC